jgi:hypothetical protein
MQGDSLSNSYDIQKLIGIIIPVVFFVLVTINTPIAVLVTTEEPPPFPPPGWESSVTIYLWAARFSIAQIQEIYGLEGGITNLHTTPFVIMTVLYFVIHVAVGMRRMPARYGAIIDFILFLIWIVVCHSIYGTLQTWSLIQVPIIPIVGMALLLVVYGNRVFQMSPTTPASSSYLHA